MKRNFENQNENDSNADTQSSSKNDTIAHRICKNWRLDDDLVCFKNV
jgi:HD-like signal output (HDOD) protein